MTKLLFILFGLVVLVTGKTLFASGEPQHVARLITSTPTLLRSLIEKHYDVLPQDNSKAIDVIVSTEELKQLVSFSKQKQSLVRKIKIIDSRLENFKDLTDDNELSILFSNVTNERVLPKQVPPGYHTPEQITSILNDLASKNSDIAQVIDLTKQYKTGPTVDGNSVIAIKISKNVTAIEDKENILIASCHHAREIITPEIALTTAQMLVSKYRAKDPLYVSIFERSQIWIIAVVNIDGLIYVHTKNNWWRKNRKLVDSQRKIYGVDLNRNYDLGWDKCGGSTDPDSEIYKGTSPFSEVESQTIAALSKDYSFAKVLDFHSYGRQVLTAYTCTKMPSIMSDYITRRGIELMKFANYGHRVPSDDGEHQEHQIAHYTSYAYLVETGDDFQPPYSEAQSEVTRVLPLIEHFLNVSIPLKGHVRDEEGKPVAAQITVDAIKWLANETRSSNPRFGSYHLFLPAQVKPYAVTFAASGFVSQTVSITINSDEIYGTVVKDIILKRAR